MRPVNLIPEDQRRGPGRNRRGGPLAYILVGALIALLAGVTLLVTTGNEISSEKAEAVELEAKNTAVEAHVAQLAAYTQLSAVHDQRLATVTSLADSRFDWERVMRELSLILPGNVWLTNLIGTVQPEVSVNGSAGIALRTSTPGPGPGNRRLRHQPGRGSRLRLQPEGHRRGDAGRRPVFGTLRGRSRLGRRGTRSKLCGKQLPDQGLHRPVPDRGGVRCRAGAGDGSRSRNHRRKRNRRR